MTFYDVVKGHEMGPALCGLGAQSLTFAALQELVDRRAGQLRAAGVGRSSRVAVVTPGVPDSVVALLSIMRCGIAFPLSAEHREVEFLNAIRFLKADYLLAGPALSHEAGAAARQAGIRLIDFSDGDGARSCPGPPPSPDDVAIIMQTSGTTGQPKRVPLTHANLEASARYSRQSMQLGPADRFLCMARFHHITGISLVMASLSAGSATLCAQGLHAAAFFDSFDEFRPTWFWAAPPVLIELMPRAEARRELLRGSDLRFIRTGSAPLPPQALERLERAFGVPVLEGYGMTETAPLITSNPLPPARRKPGSVGISAGPEIQIADASGCPVPEGSEGEILVRGANVMSGYEDDLLANADSFFEGWFRTGDFGRLDEDGYLYFCGRRREMINRGGEKVWPREVEEALLAHPDVVEAVVFPLPHEVLSEDVGAAVVVNASVPSEGELRRFAAARLAQFKVPSRIAFVSEIPKGPGGKPRRHGMAEAFGFTASQRDVHPTAPFVGPSTPLEQQLADIWAKILRLDRVGVNDDFFALGGDSLAATATLTEVQQRLGCGNGLVERTGFFDAPTIASQVRSLEAALQAAETQQIPPLAPEISYISPLHVASMGKWRADARRPPVFVVPGAHSTGQYLVGLGRALGDDWPLCVLVNPEPRGRPYSIEDLAGRLVRRMLEIQPEGPYVVAGHCFGGVVAYEIARQLQCGGRSLRLLALVDCPTPGYPRLLYHPHLFVSGALFHLVQAVRDQETGARLKSAASALTRHIRRRWQGRIERLAASVGQGSPVRAMRMYHPRPLHVAGLVLTSRDNARTGSPLDRRLGWLRLIEPRPHFAAIAGDHMSILAKGHVADLAEQLVRALAVST